MKFEDFSPAVGMLTGKGTMGKLMAQGFGGVIPAVIARSAQKDAAEEERQRAIAASAQGQGQPQGQGMKKGGAVKSSASKRADGIAQRGKTKGRMV